MLMFDFFIIFASTIKHTFLILRPSESRPVVKLRGFFIAKKTSSGRIVGETRISNCATDEEKFLKQ